MEAFHSKSEIEIKEDLTMKFLEKTNKALDVNVKLMGELGDENSYKTSNFYITINFGIIAAASFVFVKGKLSNSFSQILSLFLVGSIIAIILEIVYRKKVISLDIKIILERLEAIEQIQKDFMRSTLGNLEKDLRVFGETVDSYNTKYNAELKKIYEKAQKQDKKLARYRKWSFWLMIISISALTLVLIIESGAIERVMGFLRFLSHFVHSLKDSI